MPNALLILVADGGAHHATWTPWHAVAAWVLIIALVVWAFRRVGKDIPKQESPPDDRPDSPDQP